MNDEPQQVGEQSGEPLAGSDSIAESTEAVATGPGAVEPSASDSSPEAPDSSPARAVQEEQEVAEWADADEDANATGAASGDFEDDGDNVKPLEEASEEEIRPVVEQRPADWYILKVQSNREESIADALRRRVKVAGMEDSFHEIIVPVEMVTEFKAGKKRVVKRKLYPGYIVVHMSISDESWFLVRETPGIGDFTGSIGRPTPMLPHEVSRIVPKDEGVQAEEPKLQIGVSLGDHVKINEGTFDNFEGEVDAIDQTNGRVTVMINIFGRSTPVELEYWQIEKL